MKKTILSFLFLIACTFSSFAVQLRVNSGDVYESRSPFEYGRMVMGKRVSSYNSGDIFNFNYSAKTMSWKDYKGRGTYKMDEVEYQGNMTVFTTPHHIVKVTKRSSDYLVELVYRDGSDWYLLSLNCSEL